MQKQPVEYLNQHDVILRRPPEYWWQGSPVGNGRLGGMASYPGCFELLLNKLDIWTCHPPQDKYRLPHGEMMKLLRAGKEQEVLTRFLRERILNNSLPKRAGRVRVYCGDKAKPATPDFYRQRLSLGRGRLTTQVNSGHRGTRIETFFDMESNVLVLRLAGKNLRGHTLELQGNPDKSLGQTRLDGDRSFLLVDCTFHDGFRYVIALKINPAVCRVRRTVDAVTAQFTSDVPENVELFLTIVTSREADDPPARARELLATATRAGAKTISDKSRAWWAEFWRKSAIQLPDKLIENLWYFHLYHLACICRDDAAPGLFGLWFKDEAFWGGSYYGNINLAMTYWPVFSCNHPELGASLFKTLSEALPGFARETADLYALPGARIPMIMTPRYSGEMAGGSVRYCMSTSAMYAQLFWWRYLYSGDKDFLRHTGYPFLKAVVTFLAAYATQDEEGKYHIYPSFSPEQGPVLARDPVIDLSYFRYILKAAIRASSLLGVDGSERRTWEQVLRNLAHYPTKCNALCDSRGWLERDSDAISPNDQSHVGHVRHPALYSPLFPIKEAHFSRCNSPLYKQLENSFHLRFQQMGVYDRIENHNSFAWPWFAGLAAWLGRGDKALEFLYDRGISCQLLPNGMFVQQRNDYLPKDAEPMFLTDGCSGFLTAVNEMLLQSFEGTIFVFPAMPSAWQDVYFENIVAEGAFAVTAKRAQGKTLYVIVHSLAGGLCRLATPWPDQKALYSCDTRAGTTVRIPSGPVISFPTQKDGWYRLAAEESNMRGSHRLAATSPRQTPRRFVWRAGTLGT